MVMWEAVVGSFGTVMRLGFTRFQRLIGKTTALTSEVWALRDGLELILGLNITNVDIDFDALQISLLLSDMAAQSDPHGSDFSAAELEFLAEDETIEIVPNMRMDALDLTCGIFGPFYPQITTQVPMWLAVAMKKRGKCTIRPPEWMSVEKLTQVLEAERDSQKSFQPLPFHYVETSRLLFDHARDDIPDIYMVRSLIEDIKDVRFHKIGTGLEVISQRTAALKLEHLTAMEVNIVRPFVVRALQTFYKLDNPEITQEQDARANRRFPAANHGPKRPLKR